MKEINIDDKKEKKILKNEIESKNINNNDNKKENINNIINITNEQDENNNLWYNPKRSYSCRLGDVKNKKFNYNNEEIELNLNEKFIYLKTPQLKPKKSKLNPTPINIGSISCSTKKSKLSLLNDENIILSEGEDEESIESSSDSDFYIKKDENDIILNINEKKIEDDKKLENKISEIKEFKIEEENDDDYDENGHLILKKLRKNMIQSKKIISKSNKMINRLDNILIEKYKKYKGYILNENIEDEFTPEILHKTSGFPHHNNNDDEEELPILEFLRRNSLNLL